jgi:hypothetical protein
MYISNESLMYVCGQESRANLLSFPGGVQLLETYSESLMTLMTSRLRMPPKKTREVELLTCILLFTHKLPSKPAG